MSYQRTLGESGVLNDVSFGLIVAGHFGPVEDHGAHDVGIDTAVESANALMGEEVFGSAHDGGGAFSFGRHHFGLKDVEGVAGDGSKGTCGGTGQELFDKGGVFGGGASKGDFAGFVESEAERCVGCLAEPCGVDALPHGEDSFGADNFFDCATHTEGGVFGRDLDTSLFGLCSSVMMDEINVSDKCIRSDKQMRIHGAHLVFEMSTISLLHFLSFKL